MQQNQSTRVANEIAHGKKIASRNPEQIWGWNTPAGKERFRRRAALISQAAMISKDKHVLEIGCGTGNFTAIFAESGASIVAVDISPELLDYANNRDLPMDRIHFIEGRFEEFEFAERFDAIIGSSVLHHLDINPTVQNIFRLLKPGGVMSFAEPNLVNPQVFFQKKIPWIKARMGDSPDETAFIRWQIGNLLEQTGFIKISVIPFDWLHPSTPLSMIRPVSRIGLFMEKIPALREFAGSILITCSRPD